MASDVLIKFLEGVLSTILKISIKKCNSVRCLGKTKKKGLFHILSPAYIKLQTITLV